MYLMVYNQSLTTINKKVRTYYNCIYDLDNEDIQKNTVQPSPNTPDHKSQDQTGNLRFMVYAVYRII